MPRRLLPIFVLGAAILAAALWLRRGLGPSANAPPAPATALEAMMARLPDAGSPLPLAQSLKRLEAWLADVDVPGFAALQAPAPREQVSAALTRAGLRCPEELVSLYAWRNGSQGRAVLPLGYVFLSLEEALARRESLGRLFKGADLGDAWLPIFELGVAGDQFLAAQCADADAQAGPLVEVLLESGAERAWPSLSAVMSELVGLAESGAWAWEPSGNWRLDEERVSGLYHGSRPLAVRRVREPPVDEERDGGVFTHFRIGEVAHTELRTAAGVLLERSMARVSGPVFRTERFAYDGAGSLTRYELTSGAGTSAATAITQWRTLPDGGLVCETEYPARGMKERQLFGRLEDGGLRRLADEGTSH